MSPVPVSNEVLDPEPKAVKRPAPTRTDEASTEISLPKTVLKGDMPLIRARVLYMGPGENFAISMPGQIHETVLWDPDGAEVRKERNRTDREGNVIEGQMRRCTVLKEAVPTGITQYVFESRDTLGHRIPESLSPASYEERYRNRPFVWCEHVAHLRNFFLAKDERGEDLYHIKVNPQQAHLLTEHIRKTERARKAQEQLFSDVAGR